MGYLYLLYWGFGAQIYEYSTQLTVDIKINHMSIQQFGRAVNSTISKLRDNVIEHQGQEKFEKLLRPQCHTEYRIDIRQELTICLA